MAIEFNHLKQAREVMKFEKLTSSNQLKQVVSIDGKPLLHCAHCNRGYGYWQVFGITGEYCQLDVCVACGEPFVMLEELEVKPNSSHD